MASVALHNTERQDDSGENLSKTLYREIGVKFDKHRPEGGQKNSLSKYFPVK